MTKTTSVPNIHLNVTSVDAWNWKGPEPRNGTSFDCVYDPTQPIVYEGVFTIHLVDEAGNEIGVIRKKGSTAILPRSTEVKVTILGDA